MQKHLLLQFTLSLLSDPRQQPVSQLSGYWQLLLLSAAVVVIAAAYSVWRKRSEPYTKIMALNLEEEEADPLVVHYGSARKQ